MWNTLCKNLENKKQKNFEVPDSIVNDFEGLIRNPNNGDYINSYEWNIIKMSNDGKITAFLTSDTFIPKTLKCSRCQETIEEDKKYYCEYCNSYYHCKCIKDSIQEKPEIIQIDKPVDIFRQAYNLNLSNNYIVHNADFKWCLQKKWICPNHKDKNPIPKPKLKNAKIVQDKKQNQIKDGSKTDQTTTVTAKTSSHTKKRSRNHSTTSTISNGKQEVNVKKKENVILKFIPNNESVSLNNHDNHSNIEIKKKVMKFDPNIDPDIYIHLKNEESLSTDIINKGIK
ncbi:hypothetical protein PIROE2DRAFT_18347 [Piromyces sp. E2]|nr:hypothetical protein PIROE2DRAFT_18347 [Piromyces sp. E2]|eukprot:OUM56863.1 hypothetical protein PIROE2DRAFT_18347 [Piromyces sp. E2]